MKIGVTGGEAEICIIDLCGEECGVYDTEQNTTMGEASKKAPANLSMPMKIDQAQCCVGMATVVEGNAGGMDASVGGIQNVVNENENEGEKYVIVGGIQNGVTAGEKWDDDEQNTTMGEADRKGDGDHPCGSYGKRYLIEDPKYVQIHGGGGLIIYNPTMDTYNKLKDTVFAKAIAIDVTTKSPVTVLGTVFCKHGITSDKLPDGVMFFHRRARLLIKICCAIEAALLSGKNVVIFCENSRSRSPSVLVAHQLLFRGYEVHSSMVWFRYLYADHRKKSYLVSTKFPNFDYWTSTLEFIQKEYTNPSMLVPPVKEIVETCSSNFFSGNKNTLQMRGIRTHGEIHPIDVESNPSELIYLSCHPNEGEKYIGNDGIQTEGRMTRSKIVSNISVINEAITSTFKLKNKVQEIKAEYPTI
jgi:hypothetical protein